MNANNKQEIQTTSSYMAKLAKAREFLNSRGIKDIKAVYAAPLGKQK